nr:HAD family phosphatase [Lachnospiraceae bacterium]
MAEIRNIIFDVGDVLIGYRWQEMMADYGLSPEVGNKVGQLMFRDELWHIFDLGIKTQEEIIDAYKGKYPQYADIMEWFISHGSEMPTGRPKVWKRIHELKEKGYRLYILSNYPEILFHQHTDDKPFIRDMDGIVVSYQMHLAKPDPAIYKYLTDKYALEPNECLFFDDREENVV